MKISYTLTDEDQKKYIATNFDAKKFSLRKTIVILAIIVLSLASITLLIVSEYLLAITCLGIAMLYTYLLTTLPKRTKKKYLKNIKKSGVLEEIKLIEVTKDTLKFSSPSRTTFHNYSDITKISVVQNNFILINFKHDDSLVIPTSAFQNNEEMVDFINLVKTNAKIL